MVYSKFILLSCIIFVFVTIYTNAFEVYQASCCTYQSFEWVKCCKQNTNSLCCGTCDSMTNRKGLSNKCSYFNISDTNKTSNFIPTGQFVNFSITAFQRECSGRVCTRTRTTCSLDCMCCNGYSGEDPGFKISIWAPNGESFKYSKYLNCILPPLWIPSNGSYNFSCNYTGWGTASLRRNIKFQLNSNSWTKLQNNIPPLTLDVHIVAGDVSVPNCQYQWERSNSFISKEFGILKILLYDAYGNKVSGATGGHEFNTSQFKLTFQKLGNEEILIPGAPISTKITPRLAFGVYIVTIYSSEIGTYVITIADNQNNKIKDMPTIFYVLSDKLAKDALYNNPFSYDEKTYFEGDEWSNDFSENKGTSIVNLRMRYFYYLFMYSFKFMDCII